MPTCKLYEEMMNEVKSFTYLSLCVLPNSAHGISLLWKHKLVVTPQVN